MVTTSKLSGSTQRPASCPTRSGWPASCRNQSNRDEGRRAARFDVEVGKADRIYKDGLYAATIKRIEVQEVSFQDRPRSPPRCLKIDTDGQDRQDVGFAVLGAVQGIETA